MWNRHITDNVAAAAQDTPVLLLHGPRQSGKTFLAKQLARNLLNADYVTLDDISALSAATSDPKGFLQGFRGNVVIDEAQRAPLLLIAIKAAVDLDRRSGRFLLTGSANVLTLPAFSEALAGRVEVLELLPLSQGEVLGVKDGFVDAVFADDFADRVMALPAQDPADWIPAALTGGYPEALIRRDARRRAAWFDAYAQTTLVREVRDLANIEGLIDMPRLLAILAHRAGGLLNQTDLSRDSGVKASTLRRYFDLLLATFQVHTVHPWFTNRIKRLVKSPKVYLGDTGLLAHLADMRPDRLAKDPKSRGPLLENFVYLELRKQCSWSVTRPTILHFRNHDGREADFILEARGGRRIVAVEVKAAATVTREDAAQIASLARDAGDLFHRGVILYGGDRVVPFGDKIHAVPLSSLWRLRQEP